MSNLFPGEAEQWSPLPSVCKFPVNLFFVRIRAVWVSLAACRFRYSNIRASEVNGLVTARCMPRGLRWWLSIVEVHRISSPAPVGLCKFVQWPSRTFVSLFFISDFSTCPWPPVPTRRSSCWGPRTASSWGRPSKAGCWSSFRRVRQSIRVPPVFFVQPWLINPHFWSCNALSF